MSYIRASPETRMGIRRRSCSPDQCGCKVSFPHTTLTEHAQSHSAHVFPHLTIDHHSEMRDLRSLPDEAPNCQESEESYNRYNLESTNPRASILTSPNERENPKRPASL